MINLIKKPGFILLLILLSFLTKGIFLSAVFPIFSGQDEARHYNTIQYILEPEEKKWPIVKNNGEGKIKESFETYNFSDEIRGTAGKINENLVESIPYDVIAFLPGNEGKGEKEIMNNSWKPINSQYPPDRVGNPLLYYHSASIFEKLFSQENILVRFFSIRIFSVFLGMAVVFLSYLIALNINFGKRNSLIFAGIVAFQTRFSIYYTNINYDVLLILSFAAFTLGGVLALKNGVNWKNVLLMALSVIVAIYTKMTGLILLAIFVLLIAYLVYPKFKSSINKRNIIKYSIFSAIFILIAFIYLLNSQPFRSIFIGDLRVFEYLSESFGIGRILLTSNSYWGNLSWVDNFISNYLIYLIWAVEFFSLIGIVIFFFSKKKFEFLPEKKYILFFLIMMAALQFEIRFADLKVFSNLGSLVLGAPGRYFLPNFIAHLAVIFVGFGVLLKKRENFNKSLVAGLIFMLLFCFYTIFNVIIPRYYL